MLEELQKGLKCLMRFITILENGINISEDKLNERIKDVNFEGQKACNDNYLHEEFFINDHEADMEIDERYNICVLNDIAEVLEKFVRNNLNE